MYVIHLIRIVLVYFSLCPFAAEQRPSSESFNHSSLGQCASIRYQLFSSSRWSIVSQGVLYLIKVSTQTQANYYILCLNLFYE